MAVVHPSTNYPKGLGVIVMKSKTLKPKCIVCPGQDSCVYLLIHLKQYKRSLEDGVDQEEQNSKKMRIERIEPHMSTKEV